MIRVAALAAVLLATFAAVACASGQSSPASTSVRGTLVAATRAPATPVAQVSAVSRVTVTIDDPPARHSCAAPYPTGVPTTTTVFCADPSTMERASVLRIVDGDTIHVELNGQDETVRFYGIDTTERGQACFSEGAERTTQLVGSEVRLLPDARNRDRYGRLLRYVYTPDGLSIDAEMVDEGLAHAWRQDGALRFAIIALEDGAQSRHDGCLWK